MSDDIYFIYEVESEDATYLISSIDEIQSISSININDHPCIPKGFDVSKFKSMKLINHCTAEEFRGSC